MARHRHHRMGVKNEGYPEDLPSRCHQGKEKGGCGRDHHEGGGVLAEVGLHQIEDEDDEDQPHDQPGVPQGICEDHHRGP